VFKH